MPRPPKAKQAAIVLPNTHAAAAAAAATTTTKPAKKAAANKKPTAKNRNKEADGDMDRGAGQLLLLKTVEKEPVLGTAPNKSANPKLAEEHKAPKAAVKKPTGNEHKKTVGNTTGDAAGSGHDGQLPELETVEEVSKDGQNGHVLPVGNDPDPALNNACNLNNDHSKPMEPAAGNEQVPESATLVGTGAQELHAGASEGAAVPQPAKTPNIQDAESASFSSAIVPLTNSSDLAPEAIPRFYTKLLVVRHASCLTDCESPCLFNHFFY